MNPFTRLGLKQRLVIAEDELREAFRAAGMKDHPDAGGSSGDFAGLQEAYARLSRPSLRLRAWLAAEGIQGDERGSISPALLDLFSSVGAVLQKADTVTKRRESSLSVLAKAMLEPAVQEAREALEDEMEKITTAIREQEERFPEIESGKGDPWRTARDLAFLEKWQAELKSRFAALW